MNASDAINKIKEMLGLEFSSVEKTNTNTKEVFATTELTDGTKVTNDKEGDFELGDKVYVVAEDGTLSSAPQGEHTLRDGYVIVVDSEGTLIELRVPSDEDVKEVVDDTEAETEEELSSETEGTTELNFENELMTIKASIEAMLKLMETQTEDFSELKKQVDTFKSAPQMKGITEKKSVTENFSEYRYNVLKKHIK